MGTFDRDSAVADYIAGRITLKKLWELLDYLAHVGALDNDSPVPQQNLWHEVDPGIVARCRRGEHLFIESDQCWWCGRLRHYA